VQVASKALSDFLPPSPPAEQATARQNEAGQSGTRDWTGNSRQ